MEALALPLQAPQEGAVPLDLRGELFAPTSRHPAPVVQPGAVPWAGIGLCSSRLSVGLPVDALSLLCGLERTRRALDAPHAWCLVADSNAVAVGFDPEDVRALAARTESALRGVCETLGFPVRIVLGSAVDQGTCVRNLPPYEAFQLAQMQQMARRGATVKVGWSLSGSARDEAYFDRLYEAKLPESDLGFVYTVGGRTFDSRRPRACPYVVREPQSRLMLHRQTQLLERLDDEHARDERAVRGYTRFIRKIGRELAHLAGHRPHRCPELHVQAVLDALPED